jgi:hypothetical protein
MPNSSVWLSENKIELLEAFQNDWYIVYNFNELTRMFPEANEHVLAQKLKHTNSFYLMLCDSHKYLIRHS